MMKEENWLMICLPFMTHEQAMEGEINLESIQTGGNVYGCVLTPCKVDPRPDLDRYLK